MALNGAALTLLGGRRGPTVPAYKYYRIRCLSFSANYWWRVREFELYPESGLAGTKLIGTASASSQKSTSEIPARAVDGNLETYWGARTSRAANVDQWFQITLPKAAIVLSARFSVYSGPGHHANLIAWEGSEDGINWIVLDEQPGTSTNRAWVNFERR
ncbi:discoidin domain-containing protein [Afifella marina]|uniref:F5/8 type C domain-containing protein n=1 Tax=Afifella marina DSM 2698 TaxID=1120955 RepID=A0A1G5MFD6_AFIMA|nr:discoidin domain-containing protein [Afifella marina]MBK1625209.1 hypothetical protein [Afifella marina DSM 2698]MBK1628926.1 hypothetical protein [Afifella marina]MBK5918305.1 hypothetical protein [Afifella marina]RAI22824.1 hypothetical protein CH311_04005 [Afifella marina DSM 2698]SCZ23856.1 F5/8 type C domain-containing protein [Afifella marina DSM 2698]